MLREIEAESLPRVEIDGKFIVTTDEDGIILPPFTKEEYPLKGMAVLDTAADVCYVCADLLDVELTQRVGGWFTFMYVLQNHELITSLRFRGVEGVQIFAVAIVI